MCVVNEIDAKQRAFYAGLTTSGQCFRNFSQNFNYTNEAIQYMNLSHLVLLYKSSTLEIPPIRQEISENVQEYMYQLWILGALFADGNITSMGKQMAKFPLDPALSKLIILGDKMKCSSESLIIAAMLSVCYFTLVF